VLHFVPRGLFFFSRPEMSAEPTYISFPPGALSDEPLRIAMLWDAKLGLALNKPPLLPAFQDTRIGGGPRSILSVLNQRAASGVPQFEKMGIESLYLVNVLDRDASGVLLFAKSVQGKALLKNAMGSSQFTFRYRFLTAAKPEGETLVCDLPVAVHRAKPVALISHRTGKKATTIFRRLEDFGSCALWEAESAYDRFHQIRLHAFEVGLPLLNDPLYGKDEAPATPVRPVVGKPQLGHGFYLHLFSVSFPLDGELVSVEANYPGNFRMFLKKLAK